MSFWNTDAVKEHLRKKKGRWETPERQEKDPQGLVSITPYQRPYTREQKAGSQVPVNQRERRQ